MAVKDLTRAERRRRDVHTGNGVAPSIAPTCLEAPGHWHADAVAFSHEENGQLMNAVHLHGLATNDLVLTEAFVLKTVAPLSGPTRDRVRIEEARYCDKTECVKDSSAG